MKKDRDGQKKRTKQEAENLHYVTEAMRRVEYDLHTHINYLKRIPHEWESIHLERSHHKTRITMRVDKDVLKFFRSLGPGYQPRMNDVLRAFMHCRLSGLIDGPDTMTEYRDKKWADRAPPEFGDVARMRAVRDERG